MLVEPGSEFEISFFEGKEDNHPEPRIATWDELVQGLTSHHLAPCSLVTCGSVCLNPESHAPLPCVDTSCRKECAYKFGEAFSPVAYEATGQRAPRRGNKDVKHETLFVADIDGAPAGGPMGDAEFGVFAEKVDASGFAFICYTTHSSRHPFSWKLRLVIPFDRPVKPEEHAKVRDAVIRLLELPVDEKTKDISRIYFLPSSPSDGNPQAVSNPGKCLPVDELLALPVPSRPLVPHHVEQPLEPLPETFDLDPLRERLRKSIRSRMAREGNTPRNSRLSRILNREPLVSPALPEGNSRHDEVLKATASLAGIFINEPEEAVFELLRPSLEAMRQTGGLDWPNEGRKMLQSAMPKYKASREADDKRKADAIARLNRRFAAARETKTSSSPSPTDQPTDDEPEEIDWSVLETDAKGRPVCCVWNLERVFALHPAWAGKIRWNVMRKQIDFAEGCPLEGCHPEGVATSLAGWLERTLNMPASVHRRLALDVVRAIALENPYNPVVDYLESLQWDGKSRVKTFLREACKARVTSETVELIDAFSEKWFISAVARAYAPLTTPQQVDTVLILAGGEGERKTSLFRELAGAFYSYAQKIGDKDSIMTANSNWVIELGELSAMKRADNDVIKAFFTDVADNFRMPYATTNSTFTRCSVFVGTTNESEFLTDDTSVRRYWPVWVESSIDLDWVKVNRDQLWAEAAELYRSGMQWWLDEKQTALHRRYAEDWKSQGSDAADGLDMELYSLLKDRQREWGNAPLTTYKVAELLDFDAKDVSRGLQMRLGRALRRLGYKRVRSKNGPIRGYYYEPPPGLFQDVATGPQVPMISNESALSF